MKTNKDVQAIMEFNGVIKNYLKMKRIELRVDLNEEIVDLTKYQRAYQASSRIFSICNSLLDTLVNLGK